MTPKEQLGRMAFEKMMETLTCLERDEYEQAGRDGNGPPEPEWILLPQQTREDWMTVAEFIAAQEREAIARIFDKRAEEAEPGQWGEKLGARDDAAMIRARGLA